MRAVNEDLALESATLYAVADGMGGHAGGEVASRVAIDALKSEFGRHPSVDGLIDAVEEANKAVWDKGRAEPALRGMGTTLTAAALVPSDQGDRLVLANVGDSRAYRFHEGSLEQLTTDHSVAEELVARGELSEDEAQIHPHRHILTRALGVSPDVDVDIWEVEPQEGDRYLLCSDGLTNEVPPDRIDQVLSSTPDPQSAAEALVHLANEAGGNDNITAVVVDVLVADKAAAPGAVAVAGPDGDGSADTAHPATTEHSAATATAAGATPPSPTVLMGKAASSGGPSPQETREATRRRHIPRRVTLRVLLFVVVLGALAAGAWALIRWYVDSSYYVGIDKSQIVIYQGRPGGFVGIEPKVIGRTALTTTEVNSDVAAMLRAGVQEPTREAAGTYVQQLNMSLCDLQPPPSGVQCPPPPAPFTSTPSTSTPSTSTPSTSTTAPAHALRAMAEVG